MNHINISHLALIHSENKQFYIELFQLRTPALKTAPICNTPEMFQVHLVLRTSII